MVRYGSLNASRVPLYITSNIVPNEQVVEELNKRAYDGLVEPDSLCFNILGLEGSFKHFSLDDIAKHNSENFQPEDNPNCSAVFVVYDEYSEKSENNRLLIVKIDKDSLKNPKTAKIEGSIRADVEECVQTPLLLQSNMRGLENYHSVLVRNGGVLAWKPAKSDPQMKGARVKSTARGGEVEVVKEK